MMAKTEERGFALAELLVVIAVLGIIAAIAIPSFLSYLQAAQTRGAAQEVATILNQARQLAITRNQSVCVHPTGVGSPQIHFHLVSCAGAVWTGPGTDGGGNITLSNNVSFTAVAQITFSSLGAATFGGCVAPCRLRVQNQAATSTMDVVVNLTGRVRITCSDVVTCP